MSEDSGKSYFNIGEVAQLLNVAPSLLRFWEKEFGKQLKPSKTAGGTRKYSRQDIDTLRLIHHLIKEKGYTIKGAKEVLQKEKHPDDKAALIGRLKRIRMFLSDILGEL